MTRHPLASLFVLVSLFALAATLMLISGCQSNDNRGPNERADGATNTAADVCTHCPGVQTATADGKCPKCLMAVAAPGKADACPRCDGVQAATADGHCPVCKGPVHDACPACPGMQTATAANKCPLCDAAASPTAKTGTVPPGPIVVPSTNPARY